MGSDADELAEKPRLVLAASLDKARAGEVLVLATDGQVLTSAQRRWLQTRTALSVIGLVGLSFALGWSLFRSLLPAFVPPVVTWVAIAWTFRQARPLQRLAALIASQRDEEALAAARALLDGRLTPHYRLEAAKLAGFVAWRLGRHAEALAAFEEADRAGGDAAGGSSTSQRFVALFYRADILCALGRVDEARALLPRLEQAPHGDFFEICRIHVALGIAFAEQSAQGLTADLYDWSKAVLSTNRFGSALVLLAWAFARRGDEEMARHLLAEAGPRLTNEPLARTRPRLHAWYVETCAAWGIAERVDAP